MNVFELIVFLLICAGLGFLGHLVSPRYGWWVAALLFVPVLIVMLIGSFREAVRKSDQTHKRGGQTAQTCVNAWFRQPRRYN